VFVIVDVVLQQWLEKIVQKWVANSPTYKFDDLLSKHEDDHTFQV